MNNAVRYLAAPFLTQFFLIDAICRGFMDEKQRSKLFGELAEVFCIPMNAEIKQYYTAADAQEYRKITDYSSYERLCRTLEFAEGSGQEVGLSAIDRVILAQKREAMMIKSSLFKQSKNLTADIIADTLRTTAMNGNVDAMATLSYLEYHGLCVCKDLKSAMKRMALCAKWNHLFGNLMGIAYDKVNRETYYNTLFTVLRCSNQREVFKHICECTAYEKRCTKNPVARIIEKAFGMGITDRKAYDSLFARVAFSELISAEDKEKLLLNKKKDAIASLSLLPFEVKRETKFQFDPKRASALPLEREEELQALFCGISPALRDCMGLYRPLLVAGEDDYVSEMYVQALKNGFSKENKVIELDAGMLTVHDFAGAKENVILRGLSETKCSHTIFLIKHCDELGEAEQNELIKLLDYENRRKFKLLEPTVSIDLSDILIVLFASNRNERVRRLSEECDAVWTAPINEQEKQAVIDSMFKQRSRSFGCTKVRLDDECREYLAPFKTGQIIRLIDGALKRAAYKGEPLITTEALQMVSDQQNIKCHRREFGYQGGVYNEEY